MNEVRYRLGNLGDEERYRFRGRFERNGLKKGYTMHYEPTMLLLEVEVEQDSCWKFVTDHLWMNLTKQFIQYNFFKLGDSIEFDGRISIYNGREGYDYRISHPTKVIVFRDGIKLEKSKDISYSKEEMEQKIRQQLRELDRTE